MSKDLQKLLCLLIYSFLFVNLLLSFFVLALELFLRLFGRFAMNLRTFIASQEVLEATLGWLRSPFSKKLYHFLLLLSLLLKGDLNFCFNVYLDQNHLKFYLPHFEFQLFFQIDGFNHFLELLNLLLLGVFHFFIVHFFFFRRYYLVIKIFT